MKPRKPLKRTPLKKIGRRGKAKRDAMKTARAFWFLKFKGDCPCQWCERIQGQDDIWDIHHKIKRSLRGEDGPENLVALCRKCHTLVHLSPTVYEAVRDSGANLLNGEIIK